MGYISPDPKSGLSFTPYYIDMENWNILSSTDEPTPENVQSFFKEIEELYRKHNLSISHEDGNGAFIIENYDAENLTWLKDASLNIKS